MQSSLGYACPSLLVLETVELLGLETVELFGLETVDFLLGTVWGFWELRGVETAGTHSGNCEGLKQPR